jgi:tetratricopeptide (TPR) repeat protein
MAQADAYLAKAEGFIAAGAPGLALALLAPALELAPDYAEARFLRARLLLAERSSTQAGIAELRASLSAGTWTRTDPADAEQALAGALLRTGKLSEARVILERLVRERPEREQPLVLLARLFVKSKDAAREASALADGSARFPLSDELRLLFAGMREGQGRAAEARAIIATGLDIHPDSLPLLLAAARLAPDAKRRVDAVEAYLKKGGADALAALIALEAPSKDQKRYLALFIAQAGLARQDLTVRAVKAAKSAKDLTASLQAEMGKFSGVRDLDGDGDGAWDERWVFEKGSLVSWISDPVQDGVSRFTAEFRAGAPATFSFAPEPGVRLTLGYSRYPFVDTAREERSAAPQPVRVYSLVPYTLQCRFLASGGAGSGAGLAQLAAARPSLPSLAQIKRAAFSSVELAADGRSAAARSDLAAGTPTYREEDTDGDGLFDHRVWFSNGIPVRGERSLGSAGAFPARETWSNGVLAALSVDADGDGVDEYKETYGADPMKSWDYDEDGKPDSRERPGNGGTVVREFSTSMNGTFDRVVVFDKARIVSVTAGKVRTSVTPDAARGITWIGMPAASGADLAATLPDGLHRLGARDYFVFRYGGIVYAEEVR